MGSESSERSEDSKIFDVLKLNDHLSLCLQIEKNLDAVDGEADDSDVQILLDEYIEIFNQLYRFFGMLGTVFGFIASDVKEKVEILQSFRMGPNAEKYLTVETMLVHEQDTGYLKDNKHGNASRTFLRLHRALLFVSLFLHKTLSLADEDGTGKIARDAYDETLSKYHPWLIQKGARLAMYTLPTKKDLFKQVAGGRVFPEDEIMRMLEEAITKTKEIHTCCEKLYAQRDLLELP